MFCYRSKHRLQLPFMINSNRSCKNSKRCARSLSRFDWAICFGEEEKRRISSIVVSQWFSLVPWRLSSLWCRDCHFGTPCTQSDEQQRWFLCSCVPGSQCGSLSLGRNHTEGTFKRKITFCWAQNLTHVRVQPTLSFAIGFFRKMTLGFALFLHDTFELFSDHN